VNPAPPVVLVHGFASSYAHGWARQGWPDFLADAGRRPVGVELLGHGGSERPHEPEAYAGVPGHALAQFPDEQVDAIGFSAGAIALLRLAATHPERFRRLALLGVGDRILEPPDPETPSPMVAALGEERPPAEDVVATVLRRMADRQDNDRRALRAFVQGFPRSVHGVPLAAVSAATLVVVGDRDPAYPATRLAALIPSAELVEIPDLDHFATPSDFRVLDAVLDFVGA
jgi:pimeloyl-ACP methyl ester carboxylesterase